MIIFPILFITTLPTDISMIWLLLDCCELLNDERPSNVFPLLIGVFVTEGFSQAFIAYLK